MRFDPELEKSICEIAIAHNVEPEALMAVVAVESNGKLSARVNDRDEPLIRFEGHYFYRLLPQAKRNVAIVKGLASSKAGAVKNSRTQAGRWRFLKRAKRIDRSAALSSCSWGVGQVMGAHWRWLGYASIDTMVEEARSGVEGQVRLMMRYIEKANLIKKLQALDWAGFARAYNGPNFRRYKYDTKLQSAYRNFCSHHWNGTRDLERPLRNRMSLLRFGSYGNGVVQLQSDLVQLGFTLRVDGDFGPATERMLMAFQRENGISADGVCGPETFEAIGRKLPKAV